MVASGVERTPPLQSGRAVGQVLSVDLDLDDCAVKIGPSVVDGVTWYGAAPTVGDTVQLVQTSGRLVIQSSLPVTGGGGTGGGTVQSVAAGVGITVAGTAQVPVVSANRTELQDWFPDKDSTETNLATINQKIDALAGSLLFAGTYNAATGLIGSLSLAAAVHTEYQVGLSMVQVPSASWNARHYFIVGTEGPIPTTDDGIVSIPGSVATHFRVGDWVLSSGTEWVHLTYSARAQLASSIILDSALTGLTGTTVQQALTELADTAIEVTVRSGTPPPTPGLKLWVDPGGATPGFPGTMAYKKRVDFGEGMTPAGFNGEIWPGRFRCPVDAVKPGDILDVTFTIYVVAQAGTRSLYPHLGADEASLQQLIPDSQYSTWWVESVPAPAHGRTRTFRVVTECTVTHPNAYVYIRARDVDGSQMSFGFPSLPAMLDVIVHRRS